MRATQAGGWLRRSQDNTWRTPEWLLERARVYFGGPIPFDAATAPDNPTKAKRFVVPHAGPLFPSVEPEQGTMFAGAPPPPGEMLLGDGLAMEWPLGGVWCNPPYGKHLQSWLLKFASEQARGVETVALVPASRLETGYMQTALVACSHACLVRRRVAFVSSRDLKPVKSNVSGSLLLGFNTSWPRWVAAFGGIGLCVSLEVMQ